MSTIQQNAFALLINIEIFKIKNFINESQLKKKTPQQVYVNYTRFFIHYITKSVFDGHSIRSFTLATMTQLTFTFFILKINLNMKQ